MKVLVVGGGIGGLAVALALRQAGLDAHVFEQARKLREVGAGVATSPNAARVLHRMGLESSLRRAGVLSRSMVPRDWASGEILAEVPLREAAVHRWGAPFYHFHRADLHDALRDALGDEHITLASRAVRLDQTDTEAVVEFADGRSERGDLLIGADGVHSVVREYVAGPDRAIWSGQVAWRGLAPEEAGRRAGLEELHHSFWGPGKQFVTFYVSGGRAVNWVGNVQTADDWREESWSTRGDREDALRNYDGWHPQVRALIEATGEVYKWALFDRPPLSSWSRGRVTLLGDAAHPMLPFMAQGASQSIEDAWTLARCLAGSPEQVETALSRYVALRQPRTARVQAVSRDMAANVQLSQPGEIAARNERMRAEGEKYRERYDWLWGFDVESAIDG